MPAAVLAGLVAVVAVAYVVLALFRGLPGVTMAPVRGAGVFRGPQPALVWPAHGQAAVGLGGVGLIASRGSGRPTPIASIAKVMTAYIVLHDHPLGSGDSGPQITIRPDDVAAYRADHASGQSVVAVRAGEKLSERQALEALLLPSGNNIATLLAGWDAGSESVFVAKMNQQARLLGLAHTHYVDASGVRAATVSTAAAQVRLAMLALQIPAFRQIVAMPQVTLPVAGKQYNIDAMLGTDGIVGVKTGTTSAAGGCFVFAVHQRLGARTVTVVGGVLHQLATAAQPSILAAAFQASTRLIDSTHRVLLRREVIHRGATLAWLKTPWAARVAVKAATSASLLGWRGLPIRTTITTIHALVLPIAAGETVGTALVAAGAQRLRVRLVASGSVPKASLSWRMSHP